LLEALEACRGDVFLKLVALDGERPKIAYAIAVENSVTAKQSWRELDEEAERLCERLILYDHAIREARDRAARPDYREQWRTITKTEIGA
jgi:hypothetical protein